MQPRATLDQVPYDLRDLLGVQEVCVGQMRQVLGGVARSVIPTTVDVDPIGAVDDRAIAVGDVEDAGAAHRLEVVHEVGNDLPVEDVGGNGERRAHQWWNGTIERQEISPWIPHSRE